MNNVEAKRGKRKALPVDGVLLLNKPAGLTSNQALQKVKRLLNARKAGHTGSLDPAATGMLPLCFGEATKVCAYLLDADKTYRVTAKLGSATDTADADGTVIAEAAVPDMGREDWLPILAQFEGEGQQVPPMYSALKKDGKRLYELARQGQTVEREPRRIRIDELSLLEARGNRLVMRVSCSKGTYIRTLVEDIAKAAGTLAYTASLHRETVGMFTADEMLDLSSAEAYAEQGSDILAERLLPVDSALAALPELAIEEAAVPKFSGGQAVAAKCTVGEQVRVYAHNGQFLGVGETSADGSVAPRRIFKLGPQTAKKP